MRNYVYALLLGSIFPLGFAPFDLYPITLISISLFIFLLDKKNNSNHYLLGFFYGLGLWSVGISWVYVSIHYHGDISIIMSLLITFLFAAFLSLYFSALTFLYSFFKTNDTHVNYIVLFPILWVSIEIVRSHLFTGFPWLIVGSSLSGTSLGGWTPILGSYGSSLIILMSAGCLTSIMNQRKRLEFYSTLLFLLFLISSFSLNKYNWTSEDEELNTFLYQPNLSLRDKWSINGFNKTKKLIEQAVAISKQGDLIVFPETAIILDKTEIAPWIKEINFKLIQKEASLISGIIAKDSTNEYLIERYNRFQGFGILNSHYDKVHLVPFGEYVPLRDYLGGVMDVLGINMISTLPGESINSLKAGNIRVSPSICYEIAFNNLIRKTAKTSNLIITISNDTWFGRSFGPEQHLEIAQTRALEHQKILLRATNSGVSAIIGRKGEVLKRQGIFEQKELKGKIYLYEGNTPFSIVGNSIIYIIILLTYMYLFYIKRTNVHKY
tara:strand:- start:3359 stop:4843 length:1485 start_codon:yes stop_codon:yes gene_type:complete